MSASNFAAAVDEPASTADGIQYSKNGYVVVRKVVPGPQIARLMSCYRDDILPSRYPFFRQNANVYQPNAVTERGFVRQSFLDIHDYRRFPEFSAAARDIFCSRFMMQALRRVTDHVQFSLMQTMMFDLNTETPPHQDWYYLDTVPSGNLVAAWIALEDIDQRAGRFYVLPGSQKEDFHPKLAGRTHSQWLAVIRRHVDANAHKVSAPALQAGDVLFWNSKTVHGSLPTLDEAFSRKSLTAHYLPAGFDFGNLFSVKSNVPYKQHGDVRYYRNQPDFSQWNRLKFAIKTRAYNYPRLREFLRSMRDSASGQDKKAQ